MTLRVNASTAESGFSLTWTPAGTGPILLQADPSGDASTLIVALQAQMNAAAPWVEIAAFHPANEPLLAADHLPIVRLAWRGNKGTLNIWDAE